MIPQSGIIVAEQSLDDASVTGIVSAEDVGGSISLVLETSAGSVSVKYEVGYTDPALPHSKNSDDAIWLTPEDGGAISALTNVAGADTHASLSLPVAEYYRFTVTENNSAASLLSSSLKYRNSLFSGPKFTTRSGFLVKLLP